MWKTHRCPERGSESRRRCARSRRERARQVPSADMVAKMYEGRDYEEVSLDGMRKTIAARLTEAKQTIPHFYLRRDIKLDALLKFRSQLNKQLEAARCEALGQ